MRRVCVAVIPPYQRVITIVSLVSGSQPKDVFHKVSAHVSGNTPTNVQRSEHHRTASTEYDRDWEPFPCQSRCESKGVSRRTL
jgi:hypothetical protein